MVILRGEGVILAVGNGGITDKPILKINGMLIAGGYCYIAGSYGCSGSILYAGIILYVYVCCGDAYFGFSGSYAFERGNYVIGTAGLVRTVTGYGKSAVSVYNAGIGKVDAS